MSGLFDNKVVSKTIFEILTEKDIGPQSADEENHLE